MKSIGHFINGKEISGKSDRRGKVFNPATGEVQAEVAYAEKSELDNAVELAKQAQEKWAEVNPQKRARVIMKFVELLHRDMKKLAEVLSSEHGKTLPDAEGDIIRGLEVAEFCIGAPHLLKGEFTDSAGPGIDMYSMRQPLGVVAGITPFNFPAMIPMWKFCPAIAAGNAFILKPSERDPSVPMLLAELMIEAGLPEGILQVVNGDKGVVDAILENDTIEAVGFVGSTPIAEYIYTKGCASGKRVQCFAGAKNHMLIMPDADMDQAADALVGAGYGAAGERCMAISVAVPVGEKTADSLIEKLIPELKKNCTAKFDESLDLSIQINNKQKKSEVNLRTVVNLPAGSGKKIKVAVICEDTKSQIAKDAGADLVGGDDFIEKIKSGEMNFEKLICTPSMMIKLSKLGKVLGPKGLMPNPKLGTVTDDLKKAVSDAKSGQVEIKNDKDGNVGLSLGKKSFSDDKIIKNFNAVLEVLEKEKGNQTVKGDLIKSAFLTSTMGVSYKVKLPKNI